MSEIIFPPHFSLKCATQNFENLRNSSLWTCSHHMAILRSQKKQPDFFFILA